MKSLPVTDELAALAQRVIWFEAPEQALSDPIRFLAYAMTYGSYDDIKQLRSYYSNVELLEALEQAPPGIFDGRSWAYWNIVVGRYPPPPMPERRFER